MPFNVQGPPKLPPRPNLGKENPSSPPLAHQSPPSGYYRAGAHDGIPQMRPPQRHQGASMPRSMAPQMPLTPPMSPQDYQRQLHARQLPTPPQLSAGQQLPPQQRQNQPWLQQPELRQPQPVRAAPPSLMLPVNDISLPNPFDSPRMNGPAASAYQTPPEAPTLPLRPTVVHHPQLTPHDYARPLPNPIAPPPTPPPSAAASQPPPPAPTRPLRPTAEPMAQGTQPHQPP